MRKVKRKITENGGVFEMVLVVVVGWLFFCFVCLLACLFVVVCCLLFVVCCLLFVVVVVVVVVVCCLLFVVCCLLVVGCWLLVVVVVAAVVVVCRGGWQSNMQIYTIHGCCNMFGTISEEGWTSAKNSLHLTELFIRAGD